jgi:transposase
MEESGKARKKRSQRDYSLAFKLGVISEVEKGELTYKQAQKKYGIQGKSTVLVWLRKLGTLDWNQIKYSTLEKKQPTPEQRIKELETLLQEEKDRNLVYKTMIDIIEEQYGKGALKKSSPKPSKDSDNQKS